MIPEDCVLVAASDSDSDRGNEDDPQQPGRSSAVGSASVVPQAHVPASSHRVFDSSSTSGSRSGTAHVPGSSHRVFDSSSTSGSRSGTSASSLAEEILADEKLRGKKLKYQDHQRLLRRRFQRMSETQLAAELPAMPSGEPSSIGSVLHHVQECRPCHSMVVSKACAVGMRCMYCHLEHDYPPQLLDALQDGARGKNARRPCKAVRVEYKELVAQQEEEIKKDPFNWKVESVIIPACMNDPVRTMKFLRRLELVAAEARKQAEQLAASSLSTSAAGSTLRSALPSGHARRLVSL